MLSIGGVTLLGGAGSASLVGTGARRSSVQLLGGNINPAAALLGGSKQDFAQGLYNSLGQMVSAQQNTAPNNFATTPAQEERQAALESISEKIDGGYTTEGREEAQRLIKKNGNDITAIRLVAVSYLVERDYREAQEYYSRALSLAPTDPRLMEDMNIARSLQQDDETVLAEAKSKLKNPATRDAALRLLQNLSARSPRNAEAYIEMTKGYSANREPSRVVGALQEALRYGNDEQLDVVIAEAKKLSEQYSKTGVTHNIYGRALVKAGRIDEAFAALQKAVNIAPENFGYKDSLAGAYASRALEYLAAGNRVSAASDFSVAKDINPANNLLDEVEARLSAAEARRKMNGGRYNAALGDLFTAASKAPSDDAFKKTVAELYTRAGIYFESKDQDTQALTAYKKAFELNSDSAITRRRAAALSYEQGMEARDSGSYDAAIEHLQFAYDTLRISSDYGKDLAEAYNLRGQQELTIGNLDEAIADFKMGFGIDPTNTSLDANLSAALIQKANS